MAWARALVAAGVLGVVCLSAVCQGLVDFRVTKPSNLTALFEPRGRIQCREALFGEPAYGEKHVGTLVHGTPGDADGCQPIPESVSNTWPDGYKIVLVNRGHCKFTLKVKHAQEAGANAVVVIDDQAGERRLPYMADDGNAVKYGIRIGSVIISKEDGDKLVAGMDSTSEKAGASLAWGVPHPDNRVEWEMWATSSDWQTQSLELQLSEVSRLLGSYALFTPHFFVIDGSIYNCVGNNRCGSQCTNNGKYCAVDPDSDLSAGVSGADVLNEDVRQICLHRAVNATGNFQLWWQYVNRFNSLCTDTFSSECSEGVSRSLLSGVEFSSYQQCMQESGGFGDEAENSILQSEMEGLRERGLLGLPSFFINESPYHGSLICPTANPSQCAIFGMICAGLKDKPPVCHDCPGGLVRDACGVCGGTGSIDACGRCLSSDDPNRSDGECDMPTKSGTVVAVVIIVIVLLVTVIGVAGFLYVKRMQRQMRRDVNSIMEQYVSLPEGASSRPLSSPTDSQSARLVTGTNSSEMSSL